MRKFAFVISCCLILAGCASIISGTGQEVSFNSDPDDATVTVNGRILGKTPFTVRLDRKSGQSVLFAKEGYRPITMQLETTLNGWFWGNILTGGLIGSTTDGISGAAVQYSPNQYYAKLVQEGKVIDTNPKSMAKEYIVVNYIKILEELNTQPGQHIDALFNILHIPADKKSEALVSLKKLSEEDKDIVSFAEKVAMHFKN